MTSAQARMHRRDVFKAFVIAALSPLCLWPVKAAFAATAPALILSKSYQSGLPLSGYLVSEKYDGVRGYWDGQRLLTRAGNALAVPAWFTEGWPATPMDGELWAGRGQFAQAVSTVRSSEPMDAAWRNIRFMVFDLPAQPGSFAVRLAALQAQVSRLQQAWVQPVAHSRATTEAALQQLLSQTIAAGGEGLMLHRADALYQAGRSDDLRKLKPHDDAEARIVGHIPGKGKYAGLLGALEVEVQAAEGAAPQRFKLGTGLSDAFRRSPPPVGSWVTFRYRGLTAASVPRFASFLRMAPDPSA